MRDDRQDRKLAYSSRCFNPRLSVRDDKKLPIKRRNEKCFNPRLSVRDDGRGKSYHQTGYRFQSTSLCERRLKRECLAPCLRAFQSTSLCERRHGSSAGIFYLYMFQSTSLCERRPPTVLILSPRLGFNPRLSVRDDPFVLHPLYAPRCFNPRLSVRDDK